MALYSKGSSDDAAERSAAWEAALASGRLPGFVRERLEGAGAGRTPWLATLTPTELLLARSHGVKPLATVAGTCWFQYGYSWTEGHAAGWAKALERIKAEAVACGANAVVDVKLRTIPARASASMDFSLIGTAVRIDGLPPSPDPAVATVSGLSFVRLLEAGVVPTGLAVGARYEWLTDYNNTYRFAFDWSNRPAAGLGNFWERVRREAHADLRAHAAGQGNGVLAHTHFSELLRQEVEKQPDQYLGRHIVIGTVVQTRHGARVPHDVESVVDMRDDLSPLLRKEPEGHPAYQTNEKEGAI